MAATTRFGITKPASGDQVNQGAVAMQTIADGIDAILLAWAKGPFANRPSAGTAGRAYFATDVTTFGGVNGTLYYDDGTAWQVLPLGPDATATALVAQSGFTAASGTFFAPTVRRDPGGVIRLRGAFQNTSGSTQTGPGPLFAALPSFAQPASTVFLQAVQTTSGGTIGAELTISTTGGFLSIQAGAFANNSYVLLDGLTYTV